MMAARSGSCSRGRTAVPAVVLSALLLGTAVATAADAPPGLQPDGQQTGQPEAASIQPSGTPSSAGPPSRAEQAADRIASEPASFDPAGLDLVSGDWPQAVLERLDAQGALLRQLQVQLDALSDADGLPQGSPDADVAEDKLAELGARLQQQQQAASEAQLRAEKAEKRAAGLEEAQARMVTENERLALELATAKTRLAEALQRVVELNARLATSEARAAAGTAGSGRQTVAEPTPSSTAVAGAQAAGSASPAEPGAAYPKVTDRQGAEPDGEGAMTDQVPDQGAAQRAAQDSAMIPVPVIYEVLADDTLSRISAKVYGDANAWRRIFEANRDLLDSPDDLSLGMKLVIP